MPDRMLRAYTAHCRDPTHMPGWTTIQTISPVAWDLSFDQDPVARRTIKRDTWSTWMIHMYRISGFQRAGILLKGVGKAY